MATRTIVTSQPDVSCDVCERRLLRGEQPDVFLAAGRRRTVCELCAPRAAHEGWMRESDSHSLKLPPMRARRGRSLIDRLRQVARPEGADGSESLPAMATEIESESYAEPEPYDFLDDYEHTSAHAISAVDHTDIAHEPLAAFEQHADRHEHGSYVEPAVGVFNASEFPRRLAGVARSLGAPTINVRSAEHLSSVVRIMVAWELCWYRYEVDLSEAGAEARIVGQGTELDELAHDERVGNAVADEAGTLSLL
jgi:hypothetical protein